MKLKINNKQWNFILTDNKTLLKVKDKFLKGVTYYRIKTVYIDKDYFNNGIDVERVILHELVHIFIYETQAFQGIYDEEFVCEFFAQYAKTIIKYSNKIISRLKNER